MRLPGSRRFWNIAAYAILQRVTLDPAARNIVNVALIAVVAIVAIVVLLRFTAPHTVLL